MDFISGFAWPVPRAFASAVSAGRFEQGDVFYDAPEAYSAWNGALGFRLRIQVLDPPRSTRAAPADAEGNRFAANWSSPVTCEISDYETSSRREVRSTQGRLFTSLWRGDAGTLRDVEPGEAALPLPVGGRELHKQLDVCAEAIRVAGKKRAMRESLFVSVVDEASEPSLAKARDIEAALAARYQVRVVDWTPADAGVPDGSDYHPALRVRGLWVPEAEPDPLRELLKGVLYGPSQSAGEGGTDRFKLERHGLLVTPSGSGSESPD